MNCHGVVNKGPHEDCYYDRRTVTTVKKFSVLPQAQKPVKHKNSRVGGGVAERIILNWFVWPILRYCLLFPKTGGHKLHLWKGGSLLRLLFYLQEQSAELNRQELHLKLIEEIGSDYRLQIQVSFNFLSQILLLTECMNG